jgi:hypothetical protein
MEMSQTVIDIIAAAEKRHPEDIEAAVDDAEKRIRKLPDFDDFVNILIREAIRSRVNDCRHGVSRAIRKEMGEYGKPATTVVGESPAVLKVMENLYKYRIAGTVLGSVYGRDLADISENERVTGQGHLFNAYLTARLQPLVPANKRVRDVVPEKKLKVIFASCQKEIDKSAA